MYEDDDNYDKPAPGAVNATRNTVIDYLMHPQGGRLSKEKATELVDKHKEMVETGQRLTSFANYVGGKILRAEGLPEYDCE
jgi:hypothetical protein